MSLLPYFYHIDQPLRMLERDFSPYHQHENIYAPSYCMPWRSAFQPLERLSEAVSRLALNESKAIADEDKFQVNVDVQHFAPEEINVKVIDGHVIIEGKHEEKRDQHGFISRRFVRKYALPQGCLPDTVQSKLSSDGVLSVIAPKVLPMPSTGEKIVPIMKTGPVRMEVGTAAENESCSEGIPDQKQPGELRKINK